MGRGDIAAVGRVASATAQRGRVIQQGMEQLAGVAFDYNQRKENAEFDDQVASMGIELSDFTARHAAKQFYSSKDLNSLPNGAVRMTDTTTDDSGNVISTDRDSIPAYEVYPHLLRAKLEGMITDKAGKISNKGLRNEFIRRADVDGANRMMNASVAAEEAQQAYKRATDITGYQAAADAGEGTAADFIIENGEFSELEKSEFRKDKDNRVAVNWVVTSIRSNDPDVVMETRQLLLDPSFNSDLTEPQRQAGLGDLNARLDVLTLGWGDEKDRNADIEFSNYMLDVRKGNVTAAQIESRFDLWKATPGDIDGIKQRELAHSALRVYLNGKEVDARYAATEARRIERERKGELATKAAALLVEEKAVNDKFYSDTLQAADAGQMTLMDAENSRDAYEKSRQAGQIDPNSLDPGQFTVVRRAIERANAEAMKDAIDAETAREIIKGALDGTAPMRKTNKEHVKAVEWLVKSEGLTRDNAPKMGKITALSGIMPEAMRDTIEGNMLRGNPEQATTAMMYIDNLQRQAPDLVSVLSADTMKVADFANLLVRGGEDPAASLQIARTALAEETPESKEMYKTMYRDGDFDNAGNLNERMDQDDNFDFEWGPYRDVEAPAQMQGEFDAMVRKLYAYTKGNVEMARGMAYKSIQRNWAVTGAGLNMSGTGGTRAAKNPPELLLQASTRMVNAGIAEWAKVEGHDPASLVIVQDKNTLSDRHWSVAIYDKETGDIDLLDERWDGRKWTKAGIAVTHKEDLVQAELDRVAAEKALVPGPGLSGDQL